MMSNNLVKVEDDFQEENEISIYDIVNIFIKNIKLFVIVSILGIIVTCLYIGKRVIFDKNSVLAINYTLNYAELESYLGGKVYYPKKSPNEILLEDKYLEKFFENKELKEYYEKNVKENRDNINIKRQFLIDNKILEKLSWEGNLVRAKTEDFNLLTERPKFSKLSCKKIKEKLGIFIPSWKDAIDRYMKENNK